MKADPARGSIRQCRMDTTMLQPVMEQPKDMFESRRDDAAGNACTRRKSPVRPHQMLASCCHIPPILARCRNGKRAILTALPRWDQRFTVNRKANAYSRLVSRVLHAKVTSRPVVALRDCLKKGVSVRSAILVLAAASLTVPVIPAADQAVARGYYKGRVWQDSRGRYRCKRSDGTVGLIVGGAGGALIGRAIDTHGERATGTIIGAAAGALVGRHIDRSRVQCH